LTIYDENVSKTTDCLKKKQFCDMSNTSYENEHISSENRVSKAPLFFCVCALNTQVLLLRAIEIKKNLPFNFHFNHPALNFRTSTLQSRESLSAESGLFTSWWIWEDELDNCDGRSF